MRLLLFISFSILAACSSDNTTNRLSGIIIETEYSSQSKMKLQSLIPKGGALVNFWASWCEPCREEMPQLYLLSEKLKRQNIAVVLVSVDEDRFLFEEYLIKYPQKLAVYRTNSINSPASLPTSYIIDDKGNILKSYIGVRNWSKETIVADIIQTLKIETKYETQ